MKTISLAFLLMIAGFVSAQDSLKVNRNIFGMNTAKLTGDTVIVEGKSFDVWETANSGSKFLKVTSPRTGNDYPVWIGTTTETSFEGYPVRITKTGKKFILKINKESGNPACIYFNNELSNK